MRRTLPLSILGLFVVWIGLHFYETAGTNPLLDAREHAAELGWTDETTELRGGGYGSHLLRRFAYVELREREEPGRHVTVRLVKWIPFTAWRVQSVKVES